MSDFHKIETMPFLVALKSVSALEAEPSSGFIPALHTDGNFSVFVILVDNESCESSP